MRLKPTNDSARRYVREGVGQASLSDGAQAYVSAELDTRGGVIVRLVGQKEEAYILPYAAILKAVEEARRGK